MSVENIVINIMLAVSSCGLLFVAVFFNIKMPQLFKAFEDKTEKAFAIAAFVFGDTLLLCLLILIVNGIIEML